MALLKRLKFFATGSESKTKVSNYFKYAFGEILLIVIGIFVAMQINNWNEARKNRVANDQLLEQVHEELTQISELFERDKGYRDTLPMVYSDLVKELEKPDSEENKTKIESIVRTLFRTTAYTFAINSTAAYITNNKTNNSILTKEILRLHTNLIDLELISKRGFDLKFENFYSGFGEDVDVSRIKVLGFKTIKSLDFRNKMTMNRYVEEEITTKFDMTRKQYVLVDSIIGEYLK